MKRSMVPAIVLTFASICVVTGAAMAAVWLTAEVRVVGLLIVPTAAVASLLVLYFDWRAKLLQRRIPAERNERPTLDKAA